MDELDQLTEQMRAFFAKLWVRVTFILSIVVIGTWILMRSCSAPLFMEPKVWKIARDPSWYPLELYGKRKNMLAFSNELFSIISREQGFHFEFIPVGASNLFEGLDYENYDAVVTGLSPNSLNQKKYVFSDAFYRFGSVLIVRISSDFNSIADLEGKVVGVEINSPVLFYVNFPDVTIRSFQMITQALDQLELGKIDGVILSALPAHALTAGLYAGKLKVVTTPLTLEGYRLVARKEHPSEWFVESFDQGLKELKEDGRYHQLLEKWGLVNPEVLPNSIP